MFKVLVNNQEVDLGDNFRLEYKKVNNAYNLEDLQSDYSFPSIFPATCNNQRIFGMANTLNIGEKLYAYNCEIYNAGHLFVKGRIVLTEANEKQYKFTVLGNGASVDIMGKSLRSIDWGNFTTADLDLSNHDPSQPFEEGRLMVFPPTQLLPDDDWYDLPGVLNHDHLNAYDYANGQYHADAVPLPWLVIREVIIRFLAAYGYQLKGKLFNTVAGKRLTIPSNVMFDNISVAAGDTIEANINNFGEELLPDVEGVVRFNDETQDRFSLYDPSKGILKMSMQGDYTLNVTGLKVKVRLVGGDLIVKKYFNLYVRLWIGGVIVDEVVKNDWLGENGLQPNKRSATHYINLSGSDNIGPGEESTEAYTTVMIVMEDSDDNDKAITNAGENEGDFTVNLQPNVTSVTTYSRNIIIPNITFGDFLKQLQQAHNLSVSLHSQSPELTIEWAKKGVNNSRRHNFSAQASKEYTIRMVESGYKLNYNWPDFKEEEVVPRNSIAVKHTAQAVSQLSASAIIGDFAFVKSEQAFYRYEVVDENQEWVKFTGDYYPVLVGNGEKSIGSDFYLVEVVTYGDSLASPQRTFDIVSMYKSQEVPSGDYDISLGFYHGFVNGVFDGNNVLYPLASAYNYDTEGNKLLEYNLFYNDPEGLFEYSWKHFLTAVNGEEIQRFFNLSFHELVDIQPIDEIEVYGFVCTIKEFITSFTSKGVDKVKAKLQKSSPNG